MTTLSPDRALILMMALVADRPLTPPDIAGALDCSRHQACILANNLHLAGALAKPRQTQWTITEKGRIACALLMVKDPSLRVAFCDE